MFFKMSLADLIEDVLGRIVQYADVRTVSKWLQLCHHLRQIAYTHVHNFMTETITIIPFEWMLPFLHFESTSHLIVFDIVNDLTYVHKLPKLSQINICVRSDIGISPFLSIMNTRPSVLRLLIKEDLYMFSGDKWLADKSIHGWVSGLIKSRFKLEQIIFRYDWAFITEPFRKLLRSYVEDFELRNILSEFSDQGIIPTGLFPRIITLYSLDVIASFFPEIAEFLADAIKYALEELLSMMCLHPTVENLPEFSFPEMTPAHMISLVTKFDRLTS